MNRVNTHHASIRPTRHARLAAAALTVLMGLTTNSRSQELEVATLQENAAPTTAPTAGLPDNTETVTSSAPTQTTDATTEPKTDATPIDSESTTADPDSVEAPVISVANVATAPASRATPVIVEAPSTRPADAAGNQLLESIPADGRIELLVGHSTVLKSKVPIKRLSITQPDVAGDNEIDPTSILLTAKKAGSTQLIVWDDKEHSQVVDISVDVDLNALDTQLKKMFPGSEIKLSSSNGSIVLRGRVPNLQVADQVTQLVSSHASVLNFLELAGGQQVMLQVRFAEVSRSANTSLGFNLFASDGRSQAGMLLGPGGNPIGGIAGNTSGTVINPAVTVFGGGRIGSTAFEYFVQALRDNNLLRVLAEPNLIAISGQEASFLAGGEFPIPVPQAGGSGGTAITVEYKQFGVRLDFVPVVLGDGKIRLRVSPEVSDLDFSRSVQLQGFSIPSLTKRTVSTTLELNEGQTFAVAGLLNNRVTASKSGIPLLGDLPILGTLFRSVRYDRSETELVVLVTPRLVSPMNPAQVPELPGERWTFPTENDMFLNAYLGGPATDTVHMPPQKAGPTRFRGPYGFTPVTTTTADAPAGR